LSLKQVLLLRVLVKDADDVLVRAWQLSHFQSWLLLGGRMTWALGFIRGFLDSRTVGGIILTKSVRLLFRLNLIRLLPCLRGGVELKVVT